MRRHTLTPLCAALAVSVVGACLAEEPQSPSAEEGQRASDASAGVAADRPDHAASPPVLGDPAFTVTIDEAEFGPCPPFMPESCGLAVVQGDPGQPNADAFFKMEPGTTVPEHWHTSAERMVLLTGEMAVDYEGQQPVTITPGIYAYGPAKLPHETHCLGEEGGEECILFIAFEEPVDAIAVEDEPPPREADEEAFTVARDQADFGPCPEFMPEGCELAVIQGDPTEENADVFFKMAPGTTVPKHWHTSAERMVLVSGDMRVNYDGQPPVDLDPMTYAYGPPELPHETRCGEGENCVLFIAFEEPVDAIDIRGGNQPHHR